jgi:hypothetical protein
MYRNWFTLILICSLSVPVVWGQKSVPEKTIFFPDQPSFGTTVHAFMNGKQLKAIGIKWIRLDVNWAGVESKERGKYDFSQWDPIIEDYLANDMNLMFLLPFHYHSPVYPQPKDDLDTVVKGFAAFSKACAERYKGKVKIWEIGNEPEGFNVGGVYNQPANYVKIAKATAKAIREVDQDSHIGVLSVAWMDRPFISKCFELGLLKDGTIDMITFHGYHRTNIQPESGLKADVTWLRGEVRRNSPPNKKIIVVDSERGYAVEEFLKPKHWSIWRNVLYSETQQAAYLARHYLEEISLGIEVSFWYKDMNGETGFSFYEAGPDSRLRPMAYVLKNMAKLFDTNPKQMINSQYKVMLTDLPDDIPDPNASLNLKTYFRSYLKDNKSGPNKLIIALWNPVEAFDGKILHSRQQIGENFYEAWRAISPEDKVELPTQVQVSNLPKDRVEKCYLYDLTTTDDSKLQTPLKLEFKGNEAISDIIKVGPTPKIIVIELKK